MGSKNSNVRYISGFQKASKLYPISTPIVAFRDRDFDIEIPAQEGIVILKAGTPTICSGYRTTIENYLLAPNTFLKYIQTTQKVNPIITTEQDAINLFNVAANEIKAHQATRHALGAIVRLGLPQLPSNIMQNGNLLTEGKLPADLSKAACMNAGKDRIKAYTNKASNVNEVQFETFFDFYYQKFDADFIAQQHYFTWFNGKNLAMAIRNKYQNIDFKAYYKFALTQLGENENLPFANDLIELRDKIIELSL